MRAGAEEGAGAQTPSTSCDVDVQLPLITGELTLAQCCRVGALLGRYNDRGPAVGTDPPAVPRREIEPVGPEAANGAGDAIDLKWLEALASESELRRALWAARARQTFRVF